MLDWYGYALISLVCYGIQGFLYKVSAERKYDTIWVMFAFMSTVTVFSVIMFFIAGEKIDSVGPFLIISVLNAVFFFIATVASIETLKYVPANVFYPVMRSGVVVVIIFSFIYFHERPSAIQGTGIVLSLLVIFILTGKKERELIPKTNFRKAFFLVLIVFIFGTAVTIVIKFAADLAAQFAFIALSYGINIVLSLVVKERFRDEKKTTNKTHPLVIGAAIGLVNFFGFVTLLRAFAGGPLSIAAPLIGMAFVISIILSFIFYREKVTMARVVGILLAVGATVLLGM